MTLRWHKAARETIHQTGLQIRWRYGARYQQKYLRRILDTACLLRRHPHLGPVEPLLADMPKQYRSFVIKPCNKLIYTISDDVI